MWVDILIFARRKQEVKAFALHLGMPVFFDNHEEEDAWAHAYVWCETPQKLGAWHEMMFPFLSHGKIKARTEKQRETLEGPKGWCQWVMKHHNLT